MSELEITHNYWSRVIKQALRNSTSTHTNQNSFAYWWNEDIAELRMACKKDRRKITRTARLKNVSEENLTEMRLTYLNHKKELGELIAATKKKHWQDLCDKLENTIWGGRVPDSCQGTTPILPL